MNHTTDSDVWQAPEGAARGFVKHYRWWHDHPRYKALSNYERLILFELVARCRGIGPLTGCFAGHHNEPLTLADLSRDTGYDYDSFSKAVGVLREAHALEGRVFGGEKYLAVSFVKPEIVKKGRRLVKAGTETGNDVRDEVRECYAARRRDDPLQQLRSRRSVLN